MAFFPNSSGFIINGGNFNLHWQSQDAAATEVRRRVSEGGSCELDAKRDWRSSSISDGLMIVKRGDLEPHRELVSGGDNCYRIHAAFYGGRLVAVKTFEGPRAKEEWKVNVAFSKKSLHPNVLQIVGISDESSKIHFILFQGITSEQKMQWVIANALGTDLDTSVQVSIKAVQGIAAGLNYIKSQDIPIYAGTTSSNQKWDNIDILSGHDNEPIIAFHLSSTIYEDGDVSQNFNIKTDGRGIEVLNGLCHRLFSGANSILYDDSPKREFDAFEGLPAVTLESTGTLNPFESGAISDPSNTEKPKSSRRPRREVWWVDLGATNQSLQSISGRFQDRLNRSTTASNSLLRYIRSPRGDKNVHECPGYLREEITLTSDLSKSVIVSHAFPGQSELCSICHQLVQYTHPEPFDNNITSDKFTNEPPDPLRIAELDKFSKDFKLNKPIPEDLIPILARNEGEQQAIKEKASKDAASSQARAIGASNPTTASRGLPIVNALRSKQASNNAEAPITAANAQKMAGVALPYTAAIFAAAKPVRKSASGKTIRNIYRAHFQIR